MIEILNKSKLKINLKGKTAVFIDVSNIYYSQQTLGWEIDYQKVIKFFQLETKTVFAYFYSGIVSKNKRQQKFFARMRKFGYRVKTKEVKWIKDKYGRVLKGKGNLDIELALDMSQQVDKYNTVVLFSGDSDFVPIVEFVKRKGKNVIVFSSRGHIAKELVQVADKYIPFESVKKLFERKKSPRIKKRGMSSN